MNEKPRVYVETSIIGFLTSRRSVNIHTASKQELTARWWDIEHGRYDLFASRLVREEAGRGDADAAAERLSILGPLPRLEITPEVIDLADRLIAGSGMADKARADSIHMAISAVHRMSYLLTWNCRHIANAFLRPGITQICLESGYTASIMCTPEELRHV